MVEWQNQSVNICMIRLFWSWCAPNCPRFPFHIYTPPDCWRSSIKKCIIFGIHIFVGKNGEGVCVLWQTVLHHFSNLKAEFSPGGAAERDPIVHAEKVCPDLCCAAFQYKDSTSKKFLRLQPLLLHIGSESVPSAGFKTASRQINFLFNFFRTHKSYQYRCTVNSRDARGTCVTVLSNSFWW